MEEKYQSKTIQRAIEVLNIFKENKKLSFTDIKEKLDYNKSTLFRVLYTLEHNQYLSRDKHGRYELGLNIFILGHKTSREYQLKKLADPLLKDLCEKTNLTVHLGILNNLDVVIVNKSEPNKNMKMVSKIGSSVPAHCTGQGKTFLAYSPKEKVDDIINFHGLKRYTANTITTGDGLYEELEIIRQRGYTIDNSEHEEKIKCLAVPILNEEDKIEAALSISGLFIDFNDKSKADKNLKILIETKDILRKEMEYV